MNKILIGLGLGCPEYKKANLYDKVKSPFNIQEFLIHPYFVKQKKMSSNVPCMLLDFYIFSRLNFKWVLSMIYFSTNINGERVKFAQEKFAILPFNILFQSGLKHEKDKAKFCISLLYVNVAKMSHITCISYILLQSRI